jgi:opacity protein-like surface antigen
MSTESAKPANVNIEGGGVKSCIGQSFQPEASTGFYATLGGGYYMVKTENPDKVELTIQGETIDITDEFTGNSSADENKFGVNGGLGLEIAMGSSLALFAEGKYHLIFTEDDKIGLITVMGGLRFSLQ